MGGFLSFVKKEALHILRDKRTMLIVLLLPIVQILLFGFAISTEMNNIDFAVVAPNRTETIRQQIERMEANPYFTFKGYISQAEIDDVLRKGDVTAVVVFSEDYDRLVTNVGIEGVSEAAVQFILDASNPNNAGTGLGYLQSSFQSGISVASVAPATRVLYNPQMKSAYNFVPGVMGLILMLICAMMTSISIVREKETGTMEVLLVSPVKPLFIILAKAVPYFVLSFVNLTTILLLSVYVLDVPVAGSLFWLVVVSLLFIFVSLALGLLISTVTRTQVAAMLVSGLMLMMPTMLLSGMIFPIESMPVILQAISAVLPARWYIQAVRKLMIEGVDVSLVLMEVGILATMAVLLITVSFKKFKHRLE